MSSPFDDPEFAKQLAEMGVVHSPGMAAQLLGEMAPLLAAEGIDLDDLDGTDLDSVNAALARATARHNLELFTPIGARRTGALQVLRQLSEAIAAGDMPRARRVLGAIEPEPAGDTPAISHVIGVSLGLLDEWFTDPSLRSALAKTRLPAWEKHSRAAGTDILALARKGRAFGTLDGLHRRHSGLAIFEGGALGVAAALSVRAAFEGIDVDELVGTVLGVSSGSSPGGATPGSSFRRPSTADATAFGAPTSSTTRPVSAVRGRSSSRPVRRLVPAADRAVLAEFEQWLRKEASVGVDANDSRHMLEALFEMSRHARLDLHDPADIDAVIDLIYDAEEDVDSGLADDALDTLHDYVHFRLETSDDFAGWDEAHEIIEAELDGSSADPEIIAHAIDAAMQLPMEERRAALAQTRIVAAVGELISWIGAGRAVSSTGSIRRADISDVAGMLGISAVGVSKRPAEPPVSPIHVQSMRELPVLAAWWDALRVSEIIALSATRVRRGDLATDWSDEQLPPEELAEMIVGVFVAQLLVQERTFWGDAVIDEVISRLLRALAPELAQDEYVPLVAFGVDEILVSLQRVDLLGSDLVVPVALRAAVARGVVLAIALLGGE